mmetsp:Transcript_62602/g.116448  ORF Transcript_62602/g.116448 Transcript_62602/m.116448 type:complete len:229 (-) Transcript_62602:48-734(-)
MHGVVYTERRAPAEPYVAASYDADRLVLGPQETPPGNHLRDGEVLFEMLDKNKDGVLDRRQARAWFRGLGWCLDNSSLDGILDEAVTSPPEEGYASTSRAGCTFERPPGDLEPRPWQLPQLLDAAERYLELCGPDPESVKRALLTLSRQRGQVKKRWLRHNSTSEPEILSQDDFDQLMALCGVTPGEELVDVNTLTQAIVDTICHPSPHPGWSSVGNTAASRARRMNG